MIDATAVALAAIRHGVDQFPEAVLDEGAMEIRVLCDYRSQIVSERTRLVNRLRWHLVTIAPELEAELKPAGLNGPQVRARLSRQLGKLSDSPQLRIVKRMLRRIGEISREEHELEAELTRLVKAHTPQLLTQTGCGTITAAIIISRTGAATRFPTDACFARHTGTAPIPAARAKPTATACTAAGTDN